MALDEARIRQALAAILDPESGRDIVSLGWVAGIALGAGGAVDLVLETSPERAARAEPVRQAAEAALRRLAGIGPVRVVLTAERAARPQAAAAPPKPAKHVVAVASGKGGVGKSTVALNLAVALAQRGHAVGLLDADIYGPSVPMLTGLSGPPRLLADKRIEPHRAWGLATMSIGYLVPPDQAAIWRGPMVQGALTQMLNQVAWGPLDLLIVDMPPGTGDAALTMAQHAQLSGAVIVSTPQDLALIDAAKAIAMFGKVAIPVLGIVENMALFVCPHCGEPSAIFGKTGPGHGAEREAARLGLPFLGRLPLEPRLRAASDAGTPLAAGDPGGAEAAVFDALAGAVLAQLEVRRKPPPRIVVL